MEYLEDFLKKIMPEFDESKIFQAEASYFFLARIDLKWSNTVRLCSLLKSWKKNRLK